MFIQKFSHYHTLFYNKICSKNFRGVEFVSISRRLWNIIIIITVSITILYFEYDI